ncbi:MAG: hypothetical protein GZ093_13550 [Rhodoferax sp.]|uniref:hypothetical protein n=1 Tax=Rhodoferax sp. TaxID=50421 RepID=UPI0014019F7A|nr:hypothetical protein [Rhodoferax sp.]NDP39755.1 hypothetical protein [Rhodoferax sp.]
MEKLMSGLNPHFGTNASLNPQDTALTADFLVKNASIRWTSSGAPLRITDGKWNTATHSELATAVCQGVRGKPQQLRSLARWCGQGHRR